MVTSPRSGIAIMGATATGKSDVAVGLAQRFDGEIISMDSRQVYRGLDIGTAKMTVDERGGIPHHLIDILDPDETTSAGKHSARVAVAAQEIASRGKVTIIAGGTGFYFRAFFRGLIDVVIPTSDLARVRGEFAQRATADLYAELSVHDPDRASSLPPNDRIRIMRALEIFRHTGKTHTQFFAEQKGSDPWSGLKIVLSLPREDLRRVIAFAAILPAPARARSTLSSWEG